MNNGRSQRRSNGLPGSSGCPPPSTDPAAGASAAAQLKRALRRHAEAARAALGPDAHRRLSQAICRRTEAEVLQPLAERLGRKLTVMGYMPFRTEADIVAVLEWCWRQGYTVLLPRVVKQGGRLTLHRVGGLSELSLGAWGIREPGPTIPEWSESRCGGIDAILVPGLAFDERLGRLGYGGGYYDRWLAERAAAGLPDALAVAPAFELQVVPAVPSEPHDFRIDVLVTEERVVRAP